MLRVREVQDLEAKALAPYRTLRRHEEHCAQGIFVAEGEKVVRRLLESELAVVSVLLTPGWLARLRPALEQRAATIPEVFVAEQKVVETIVGFRLHQGIMAVGHTPPPRSLAATLATLPRPWFLVALDGLSGPENVGIIVRNCVAFGVQAMVVGETSSSPYLRRSVRNSMGTIFRLPIVQVDALAATLRELGDRDGVRTLAADAHAIETTLMRAELRGDICLVFGSEATGLAPATLAACRERIAIPMTAGTDSLNVSNASAVFLYEAMRQRSAGITA
jgi:tRNA G18 (ribose-2'-O)-methylase SpoU